MAGIDLATAEAKLSELLTAQSTILSNGKYVAHNGRALTNHDLSDIQYQIDYWNRMVQRLSRGSGVSCQRVIIND